MSELKLTPEETALILAVRAKSAKDVTDFLGGEKPAAPAQGTGDSAGLQLEDFRGDVSNDKLKQLGEKMKEWGY